MTVLLEIKNVSLATASGRALFRDLSLSAGRDRVAIVGRNGVGKSTLLSLLAGHVDPSAGRVRALGSRYYLPQLEDGDGPQSRGELRRQALEAARASQADVLLLDEPTLHLDDAAVTWLRSWLTDWHGCVLVASHDPRLLADFRDFFVVSEAGCHHFAGSLEELTQHLEREHDAAQARYLRGLHRLAAHEAHTEQVARRKARKKRKGRISELDRATPRIRLNQKRDHAQVSHGRLAKLREAKQAELRAWTQASRRALDVELSLDLPLPKLPPESGCSLLDLNGVAGNANGRELFREIELSLGRQRIAVVGPNGAGKTTLLRMMLGQRRPDHGTARIELSKVGSIEQGGRNWLRQESLRALLAEAGRSSEEAAKLLVAHKFPLSLGERPLCSLSPGERARAALLVLFARVPAVELLILDEPTFGLDLVGLRALTRVLAQWPGGLVVTSHDHAFLEQLRISRTITLGASLSDV